MVIENSAHKKSLKITFVMGSLTAGGAEKVASFLMSNFDQNGHKVSLITRHGRDEDFFSVPDSIKRIVLGGEGESANKWVGLIKNVAYIAQLRKALKNTKPDVVISFLTRPNVYTILATRFMNCRMIISERNDTTRQKHEWPWHELRKKMYQYADVVTANSREALEGMKAYVPKGKLKLVANPVVTPKEGADPANSKIILNVGRLEKVKNQRFIMEAFAKTNLPNDGWSLAIAGDGSEAESLTDFKNNLDCKEYIHLAGMVKNIDTFYRKAGFFVLASNFEGTPNALLEAMSHGLPSLVSDSLPGAVELIGEDCGVVFQHGSLDDFSKKMVALAQSPQKRTVLGENARERVQEFTPDKIIDSWNRIISDGIPQD